LIKEFDYIITGAGCAGLSLAMHMIHSGKFRNKKVLLIDKDVKQSNDRTWCFWEKEAGIFEPIVYHKWDQLWFYSETTSKKLSIRPYAYKMIRGIDFYNYCMEAIKQQSNFTLLFQKVDHIFSSEITTGIITEGRTIHCDFIFNSIIFNQPELARNDYWLLQHFKGWIIETEEDAFDPAAATMMDFRVDQSSGTAFFYVLPFSNKKALVEYTVFSETLLPEEDYNKGLRSYISQVLKVESYRVCEEESGRIPMTNFHFSEGQNNITNIGTAGGQTKGSSGYTFNFIQRHSKKIIHELITSGNPYFPHHFNRFQFYDSVLLYMLYHKTLAGKKIFSDLFLKNDPATVLRFLDNQSSFSEDLSIVSTLPKVPFLTAAIKLLF
jgi:lycopene beta-cyclase